MSKHCDPHFPRQDTEVRPRPQQHASTSDRRHSMDPQSSGEVQALREQVRVLAAGLGIDGEYEVPEEARREARAGRTSRGDPRAPSPHAGTSPTSDEERHSKSRSGPTADSLKESQLAASRSLPSRPDVTGPIQQQASKQQRGSLWVWRLGALPLIISQEHAGGMAVEVLSQSEPGAATSSS